MRIIILALSAAFVAGCSTTTAGESGGNPGDAVAENPQSGGEERVSPAESGAEQDDGPQMWSRETLDVQQRMEDFQERVDHLDPATTEWRKSDRHIPQEFTQTGDERAATPGALLGAMTEALRLSDALGHDVWEKTTRVFVEDDENAVGIIMQWGFKDDSLAGSDLRVRMVRDDRGWYVSGIDARLHCYRGVTGDRLCV